MLYLEMIPKFEVATCTRFYFSSALNFQSLQEMALRA